MARIVRIALAAAGLMAMADGVGATEASLIGTSWRAETILGRPVIDIAASTVTIGADGQVTGSGGCNRYFGPAEIGGGRLSFGLLGATQMACSEAIMDQEMRFFEALSSAERWELDEHGLLLIHSTGADEPSRFAPLEE
jgi:putative lipoprotein